MRVPTSGRASPHVRSRESPRRVVLLVALASTLAACSGGDPQDADGSAEPSPPAAIEPEPGDDVGAPGAGDPYYPNDGNGGYDAAGYRVAVTYDPERRHLAGTSTMTATATQNLRKFNLDLRKLEVKSVEVDDAEAEFTQKASELTITPGEALRKGDEFIVRVRYAGKPSTEADTGGVGKLGWLSTRTGSAYALGEPHSASFWFPVNETPRDTATFQLAARVPKGWTAVSIGRQGKSTQAKGWTTYRWVERAPVASYLTTIAVDKFDLDTSKLSNGVPVVDAFAPGAEGKKQIAGRLDDVVTFLSERFGPYPQSSAGGIYMAASIPFALETNGRPTYASWAELPVVVHEYAHQWFGNSVTLESWSDICLNECFASYAEWLWAESEDGVDLDEMYLRTVKSGRDQFWLPKLHQMGSGKEFSGVYEKGPVAMHALRAELGDATFDKVVKGWASAKRQKNASWPEFERYVEKVSGKQLDGFFDAWFRGTTKPAEKYLLPGRLGD